MQNIDIKLLNDEAIAPTRGNIGSAGLDIYSPCDCTIEPHTRQLISTGVALDIPYGYYGQIAPRSGLALKNGIDTLAGVIDFQYHKSIGVILYNTDKEIPFKISKGDRIAQIIFLKVELPDTTTIVDSFKYEYDRDGFGSTGQ